MNRRNPHVWLNRRADGLTRRYCEAYKPLYRRKTSPSRSLTPAGRNSSDSHLQAREDESRRWVVFVTNLCHVVERSSAKKNEEKRGERARDVIASSFCYTPCWASHFTGPPWYVAPIQQIKAGPHPPEEGGSQPRLQVEERERREGGGGVGGGGEERKPIRRHTR